jgi:isopenicillin-N epimerase
VATDDATAREFIALVSRELHVEVAANPWRGRGWLRLCAHAYNQESDYEIVAKGLPGLLG